MMHENRIVAAFKSNRIEKILLIDDAYDPPELNNEIVAQLADFLNGEEGQNICYERGIEHEILETATAAAEAGEIDRNELEVVYRALYAGFSQTGDRRFDPAECFHLLKENALADLRPLHALLCKCGDLVEVRTAGLENGMDCYREFSPQILFLDYYLADDVIADEKVSGHKMTRARKASLDLLKQMVETADAEGPPAIVLMSSRQVKTIDPYRHEAGEQQILSLRFHFLHKKLIRQEDQNIVVGDDAADALLDTSQGYLFGKQLQQALAQWKKGAESALDSFMKEVGDLHMKDFAYLLRFRLREEGQPFGEYLEWFFGECLKGLIEEKVDWEHASFSALDDNGKTGEMIEGAFEGPSNMIARFFHRVRVNSRRADARCEYRLGDLYVQTKGLGIRAVINPDCDLVVRNGGPKAKSVLTMVGKLHTFDKKDSVADDFLIRNGTPYSVHWDPKDLETFPISGDTELKKTGTIEFLGTLRPLYAQEMQRRVLTDLSRVGLPVAPAFGISVPTAVWRRTKSNDEPFKRIEMKVPALATIIPSRAGQKGGPRVLLRRSFFNEMIRQLWRINLEDMDRNHANLLRNILKESGIDKLYDGYLRAGGQTGKKILGTGFVMGDGPNCAKDAPWLQIVLTISDEMMEELRAMDPLVDFRH